jgi:hypothetical protein
MAQGLVISGKPMFLFDAINIGYQFVELFARPVGFAPPLSRITLP